MITTNICICTYQRNQLLEQCLKSLALIEIPKDVTATITVIDNDKLESARAVVNKLRTSLQIPLEYVSEHRRGIPCARNRAIDETHRLGSDYLIFIDDDEQVTENWLRELCTYNSLLGGKSVISGRVISQLPSDIPEHIRALFQGKTKYTGDSLSTCATNNVMIPTFVTQELGLRFDETLPLAGGTDTIFFFQAHAQGVAITHCNEAVVRETIPATRTNLKWLSKRKFRAGITDAWRKKQNGRQSLAILLSASLLTAIESIKSLIFALLLLRHARNKSWLKACKYAGVATGAMGANIDSYKQVDGN